VERGERDDRGGVGQVRGCERDAEVAPVAAQPARESPRPQPVRGRPGERGEEQRERRAGGDADRQAERVGAAAAGAGGSGDGDRELGGTTGAECPA
jgi:hypothetical protein